MRKEFNAMLIVLVCTLIGFIFAQMIAILNENGILIDKILSATDITLAELQFVILFLWLVFGLFLGVTRR